jgi:outer membrane protein insertion porin family
MLLDKWVNFPNGRDAKWLLAVSLGPFLQTRVWFLFALVLVFCLSGFAQGKFEERTISNVTVAFEGTDQNAAANERYTSIARTALGDVYSAVKVRDAIEKLYGTNEIAFISVEATQVGANSVSVRVIVKRKTRAQKVTIHIQKVSDPAITEQDLLFKLNILEPGTAITEQTLKDNANIILEYLRDIGYYKAEVNYTQTPLQTETEVAVTFEVNPNKQATVEAFNIKITDFDSANFAKEVKLQPGKPFSRSALSTDLEKIRSVLRDNDFLAPFLEEPRVVYDGEKNTVTIDLIGAKGPKIEVIVDSKDEKVGKGTQEKLLPVIREGTLDYGAIVEGERRLENHFQEQGYFFANVTPFCSVEPPLNEGEATAIKNDTESLCSALNSAELTGKTVTVKYRADLNRKLKLVDIRLRGTDQFTITDIQTVLDSQEANILGIIPLFGYGRGYTSERILDEDAATIRSLLRELGYRDAEVRVNQGVSPDGNDLIITFEVDQKNPTVISGVEITGNSAFTTDELMARLPPLTGKNFSRAKVRNAERKLSEFYSQAGYYKASVDFSVDTSTTDPGTGERLAKVTFTVKDEGRKVFINRILVTGNEKTKPKAVLRALTLQPGDLLRAADVYSSEQNLYGTDVFSSIEIKPEPAGEKPDGSGELSDIIVGVKEQAPRILSYGGGFSTDLGLSGFADLRHLNLFGNLWQGGARVRMSQRQQLAQIDFLNPRFIRDGTKRYAPLTLSAQYQRDSTVTRFFRSAFDKGTFGIVQRLDENGNPIDEFGNDAGSPTLNRLTLTAETNRTNSRKNRSVLYFKYRFEDVRLYNIQSLLIKDLLIPDSRIRISGFGATFVRDTRQNCAVKYSILDIIARGGPGEPCRYSASDPTNGQYITAEYNVSLPVLGANIGFNKLQVSYNFYHTVPYFNKTIFAGRAILGLAHVFHNGDRFDSTQFPGLDGILPISERFFAGGANTLRGFDFESAGPRVVVVPQGTFRNSRGESVFLDPFTIPFGGNALAVVNLEARIPLTKSIRAVPFYDGGNVFRRVSDIFNPPDVPPGDVFRQNLRVLWSHTVGLGLRIKTPVGGEFGVDYGYLLNPPRFVIPQVIPPNAIYQLPQSQIHFRFSQAF